MPAQFRFGIGRRCVQCGCYTCTIATNDFGTNLDNMTIVAGTPSIAAGLLVMAAGDLIVFDDGAATEDDWTHFTTLALTTNAAATMRLVAAYVDANNYIFGELARSAGVMTIRVGERVSGTDSYLDDPLTLTDTGAELDALHAVSICWEPGPAQAAYSTQQGPNLPLAATGLLWTDPQNVKDRGTNNAVYTLSSGISSNSLDTSGYSFMLPPGATITGIGVTAYGVTTTGVGDVRDTGVTIQYGAGSGTNQATNTTIGTGPVDLSWGGAGNLMGCTSPLITWRNVNDPTFGVALNFTDVVDGDQISLDAVEIIIYFDAPERGGGKVSFTYTNSGDHTIQCVRADGLSSAGLKAGISDVVGSWDFESATYSYIATVSRPSCPECTCGTVDACNTCENEQAPVTFAATFSGWAQDQTDTCVSDNCDLFNDTFLIERSWTDPNGGICLWYKSDTSICDYFIGAFRFTHTFSISVSTVELSDGTWQVQVLFVYSAPVGLGYYQAFFTKNYAAKPDCSNFSSESIPFSRAVGNGDENSECVTSSAVTLTAV